MMTFNEALDESMNRTKNRDKLKGYEEIYNGMLDDYHRYVETENVSGSAAKKMRLDIDNYFTTVINPLRKKIVESRHKHDEFWGTLNAQQRIDFKNKITEMVREFYMGDN